MNGVIYFRISFPGLLLFILPGISSGSYAAIKKIENNSDQLKTSPPNTQPGFVHDKSLDNKINIIGLNHYHVKHLNPKLECDNRRRQDPN